MASHITIHVDGKQYRRNFATGRAPKDKADRYVMQPVSLPPSLKQQAKNWKARTGKTYSAWVRAKMLEEIYRETA